MLTQEPPQQLCPKDGKYKKTSEMIWQVTP